MLVKVDQVRHVIAEIYYKPSDGRERVYIFSDADFMKEAANSLLKILEEPPDFATILLLTDNPAALLPTIRSRCMHLRLSPLTVQEVEDYLAKVRPEWKARERALIARISGGGLGRARGFDLAAYLAARQDALTLLAPAMGARDHSDLFKATDTYRSGAEGKAKIDVVIRTLYSLLEDLLFLKSGTPELVRNQDILAELNRMSEQVDFYWIVTATQRLGELESGMRRNLLAHPGFGLLRHLPGGLILVTPKSHGRGNCIAREACVRVSPSSHLETSWANHIQSVPAETLWSSNSLAGAAEVQITRSKHHEKRHRFSDGRSRTRL